MLKKYPLLLLLLAAAVLLTVITAHLDSIIDTKCIYTEISSSDDFYSGLWAVTHEMNKGNNIELTVTQNVSRLSDGMYKCVILLNQSDSSEYSVENINIEYKIDTEDTVISDYIDIGNGNHKKSEISYKEETVLKGSADDNYIRCEFIIQTDSPEDLHDPEAISLNYNIAGSFPYTANKFYSINPLPA